MALFAPFDVRSKRVYASARESSGVDAVCCATVGSHEQ